MFSVPSSASINILKQNTPSRPPPKVLHPSGPTTAKGLHDTMTCFLSPKQLHAMHFQPSFPGQVRAAEGATVRARAALGHRGKGLCLSTRTDKLSAWARSSLT